MTDVTDVTLDTGQGVAGLARGASLVAGRFTTASASKRGVVESSPVRAACGALWQSRQTCHSQGRAKTKRERKPGSVPGFPREQVFACKVVLVAFSWLVLRQRKPSRPVWPRRLHRPGR